MQTLCCPMCRHPVLTLDVRAAPGGVIAARCHSRHCAARPLLRWRADPRGRFLLAALDRAPGRLIA